MCDNRFSRRLHIAVILFFVCIAVIAARTLYIGFWAREKYLTESDQISVRNITIPAHRGMILDKNGKKLVWTGHRFELWCTLRAGKAFSRRWKKALKETFPDRNFSELTDWSIPLCLELRSDEIAKLAPLIRTGCPLKIRTVRRRMKRRSDVVDRLAGDMRNGSGISGWELEYDHILKGKNGRAKVVVDRRQNWLPGSFELIENPVHGKDITLTVDIEAEEEKEKNK